MPPKPPKMGVNRQFQAKTAKYKNYSISGAVDIIRTAYYIRGLELIKLIFAVLDVSLTMGLTRCYKTEGFLHLLIVTPISYRFEDIADYCLNFGHFAFYSPLWGGGGGLGSMYTIRLRPVGKRVVDFLTGSTVALHCCKAHSKINRKMG